MSATRKVASAFRAIHGLGAAGISGILLLIAAAIAFTASNSPWSASYLALWQVEFSIGLGDASLEKPLLLWINDGLMAIFFLLVGLEIKRELLEGALSTRRRAALPLFAALGGIVVPAALYSIINLSGGDPDGWAVPAATDIAFALGILALFGKRVPVELKIFLTAVAVIDDLGAIVIIAVFFTGSIATTPLAIAGLFLLGLFGLGRVGVRRSAPYVVGGIALWLAVLQSGMHATVAGVLLAAVIPARRDATTRTSPLLRWEHGLQPYVLYAIVPIFALANAGVTLTGSGAGGGLGPVGWGVAAGLMFGKPLGVMLGALLGVRLGLCERDRSMTWSRIHAAGWLAGIGFTMSLFINNLALTGSAAIAAKLGLLLGSLGAGIVGSVLLLRTCRAPAVSSRTSSISNSTLASGEA